MCAENCYFHLQNLELGPDPPPPVRNLKGTILWCLYMGSVCSIEELFAPFDRAEIIILKR